MNLKRALLGMVIVSSFYLLFGACSLGDDIDIDDSVGTPKPTNLESYLATLPTNSPSNPHTITLKVTKVDEFETIRKAFIGAPQKYVNLDLSGSTVTSIPISAFEDCTSLTSVTIPNSVTSIEEDAFSGCTSLTSVTIPNSVTSIGENAFYNCESLASLTFSENSKVTSIGDGAFVWCESLTSVTIPNSVTSIGDSAFRRCESLTSITIPNSVTNIGYGVFFY
jgi:hypothetical protein